MNVQMMIWKVKFRAQCELFFPKQIVHNARRSQKLLKLCILKTLQVKVKFWAQCELFVPTIVYSKDTSSKSKVLGTVWTFCTDSSFQRRLYIMQEEVRSC